MDDSGRIILSDEGRVINDNGSSRRHGIIITVDYHINPIAELMTYRVMVNERVVKQVYDVPYSYEELNTQAVEFLFKHQYNGLHLSVKIVQGEPHG